MVEQREGIRICEGEAAGADVRSELVGAAVDLVEERRVGHAGPGEVGLHPLDRILQLPRLELGSQAVTRRVVRRRVWAHAIGERLDERRAAALASTLQCGPRHREDGEDVVAVDAYAGKAETTRPLVERDAALLLQRLGDRPLVVLAEEHDRRLEDARPDERLVDVTLARGPVAEERPPRAARPGPPQAHPITGTRQPPRAD